MSLSTSPLNIWLIDRVARIFYLARAVFLSLFSPCAVSSTAPSSKLDFDAFCTTHNSAIMPSYTALLCSALAGASTTTPATTFWTSWSQRRSRVGMRTICFGMSRGESMESTGRNSSQILWTSCWRYFRPASTLEFIVESFLLLLLEIHLECKVLCNVTPDPKFW